MTTYTGLRVIGQAIQLCRRVASLPATGAYVGEPVVVASTGATYEWNGSAWSPKGQAAPPAGIPVGGSTGEVLTKASGADYDTVWAAGGGGGGASAYDLRVGLFYAP